MANGNRSFWYAISSLVKLNGYLPDVIDVGIYVLGIAAKQNNKENYSLIGFAESMSSKPIDSTPIGLPMEVKSDKVIVNGIEFERKQTSDIDNISCTLGERIELFDIHGKRVCPIMSLSGIETLVPSGIYILREENGKRRKIFIK